MSLRTRRLERSRRAKLSERHRRPRKQHGKADHKRRFASTHLHTSFRYDATTRRQGILMATTLAEGDAAPDFDVETDRNEHVKLSDLRGEWVVLYWYPKDDTPGCTTEACGIRDNWQMLSGEAKLFGISPDSVKSHQKFRDKFNLPFPLLADEGHQVSER